MITHRLRFCFLFLLLGGAFAAPCLFAEDRENEIKAAYLFSFTKYATWPDGTFNSPTDPIVICVLGDNPFEKIDFEERLKNRTADGRPVQIRFAKRLEDMPAVSHLVFVSESKRKKMEAVIAYFKDRHVLTVSDISRFCDDGGMIGFIRKDEAIRFEVNLQAVEKAGIKLSSNLLKLAPPRKQEPR
jgi:hypothetical protein